MQLRAASQSSPAEEEVKATVIITNKETVINSVNKNTVLEFEATSKKTQRINLGSGIGPSETAAQTHILRDLRDSADQPQHLATNPGVDTSMADRSHLDNDKKGK